ncbi:MAG: 50S ribosomal protein L25 [Saprospiraceae bacterium]|nr:50S ribosomal protein L25 [Saprospiraceae bacterium]
MNTVSFTGIKRDVSAKASALRNEGRIPAVMYGGDTLEHFSVTQNDIKGLIFTPDFKLGEVDLDGQKYKCIIKSIQWHPITDNIEHVDFLAIESGRKVKVEIPIRFKGVSPGVKSGGKLMQSLRRVKVKVDPEHLVDELFIDISNLELGFAVKVKDIEANENMEIMVNSNIPVASVETPRALKSAAAEAEKVGEGEEVPVEGATEEAPAEEA